MATATAKSKKIKVEYSDITLKLTPREAQTLWIVTQYVGGNPGETRRGDIQAIQEALCNVIPDLITDIEWPIYRKFLDEKLGGGFSFKPERDVE